MALASAKLFVEERRLRLHHGPLAARSLDEAIKLIPGRNIQVRSDAANLDLDLPT